MWFCSVDRFWLLDHRFKITSLCYVNLSSGQRFCDFMYVGERKEERAYFKTVQVLTTVVANASNKLSQSQEMLCHFLEDKSLIVLGNEYCATQRNNQIRTHCLRQWWIPQRGTAGPLEHKKRKTARANLPKVFRAKTSSVSPIKHQKRLHISTRVCRHC